MTTTLARAGASSYNGVNFGVISSTEITANYHYDRAGRSVTYTVLDITIKSYIQEPLAGTSTDEAMLVVRSRLRQPGGEFHLDASDGSAGFGFGPLTINVQGQNAQFVAGNVAAAAAGLSPAGVLAAIQEMGTRDVVWGPKPQLLSFKPLAAPNLAAVTWRVQIAIAECPNLFTKDGDILEANYRVHYSIDWGGYSTRTISGYLIIAQTRKSVNDRTVQFTADQWRTRITPKPLDGFRRTRQDFTIDESKNTMNYTFVDVELPLNVPPPGVVEVSASQDCSITSRFVNPGLGQSQWEGRISATYEVAKNVERRVCLKYFADLLRFRLSNAIGKRPKGSHLTAAFLTGLALSEPEIYGRRSAYLMASYRLTVPVSEILFTSGLWKPLSAVKNNVAVNEIAGGANWNSWHTSLFNTAFHERGFAKLSLPGSADAIIDICDTATQPKVDTVLKPQSPPPLKFPDPDIKFKNEVPPKAASWFDYQAGIYLMTQDNTIEMKPLPKQDISAVPPSGPPLDFLYVPDDSGNSPPPKDAISKLNVAKPLPNIQPFKPAQGGKGDGIVQIRTKPRIYAIFWGHATRAGFTINPPALKIVGGVKAIPANRFGDGFTQWELANYFGVVVYRARWQFRYLLPSMPTKPIEVPKNPLSP